MQDLGPCFSNIPKTIGFRKAISNTPTSLLCKTGLFLSCKGDKN